MNKNMPRLTELGDCFVPGPTNMSRLRRWRALRIIPIGIEWLASKAEPEIHVNARLYASCRVFFWGAKKTPIIKIQNPEKGCANQPPQGRNPEKPA